MTRIKKKVLPGISETLDEVRWAKFRLSLACRLLQSFVQDSVRQITQCQRYGSSSDFTKYTEETEKNINLALEEITREGQAVRLALKRLHDTTKGDN